MKIAARNVRQASSLSGLPAKGDSGRQRQAGSLSDIFRRSLHVALRRPESMKSAVRSPAFRPQAFGFTEWVCIRRFRLKAGLRTDFPQETETRRAEGAIQCSLEMQI